MTRAVTRAVNHEASLGEVSLVKPKVEAVKIINCWKWKERVVSKAKTRCPLVHEAEPTPKTADYTSPSSRQHGASGEETSSGICRFEAVGTSLLRGLGFLLGVVSIIPELLEAFLSYVDLRCPRCKRTRERGQWSRVK